MEDVYTIKVKTKPDTRNLYPSERRYSASTVSGLAWVHIALAATSFLLACLALINPNADIKRITLADTEDLKINGSDLVFNLTENEFYNETNANITESDLKSADSNYILVLAPILITVFGLAAGVASIVASVRWYIDHNITWLCIMSILSTAVSFSAFVMIAVWFVQTSDDDITEFYKDKVPFKDVFVVKHTDVIERNESHMIISMSQPTEEPSQSHTFTKRVLSINVMIAAFLECLWSILSVKISYKGMKNTYKEDNNKRGNCISVVTTIKGNDTRNLSRNSKLVPPKSDLIDHYPSKKIKRIFLAQSDNGFYLKNQNKNAKPNTETSSEIYKERMMNFLNRCASLEGVSNPEIRTPSVQSEAVLNPIIEVGSVDISVENRPPEIEVKSCVTPVSWGDTPEHTVYNQNTLNFDRIFNFNKKIQDGDGNKSENGEASENKN